MQLLFLGELEIATFTDFDPRGEESLAALQSRFADEFIPYRTPSSQDLSPLLDVFHERVVNRSAAYRHIFSEVLSSNVYVAFKNTDLKDSDEVTRIGRGIRELFRNPRRSSPMSVDEFERLCKIPISPNKLKELYRF